MVISVTGVVRDSTSATARNGPAATSACQARARCAAGSGVSSTTVERAHQAWGGAPWLPPQGRRGGGGEHTPPASTRARTAGAAVPGAVALEMAASTQAEAMSAAADDTAPSPLPAERSRSFEAATLRATASGTSRELHGHAKTSGEGLPAADLPAESTSRTSAAATPSPAHARASASPEHCVATGPRPAQQPRQPQQQASSHACHGRACGNQPTSALALSPDALAGHARSASRHRTKSLADTAAHSRPPSPLARAWCLAESRKNRPRLEPSARRGVSRRAAPWEARCESEAPEHTAAQLRVPSKMHATEHTGAWEACASAPPARQTGARPHERLTRRLGRAEREQAPPARLPRPLHAAASLAAPTRLACGAVLLAHALAQ